MLYMEFFFENAEHIEMWMTYRERLKQCTNSQRDKFYSLFSWLLFIAY